MYDKVLHCNLEECENIPDGEKLESLIIDISKKSNLNYIKSMNHTFKPQGSSAILLLKESHFAVHTYPEDKKVLIDISSCGTHVNYELLKNELIKTFKSKVARIQLYNRDEIFK